MSPFIFERVIERLSSHQLDGGSMIRADIAAIKNGIEPSQETLNDAPLISHWQILIGAGVGCLSGTASGHPIVRDGLVVTSPICAIDITSFAWARTVSRFYRLVNPIGSTHSDSNRMRDRALVDGDHDA